VDAAGTYYWNDTVVSDAALALQLQAASLREPQPELHIRGDKAVRYERVALAMAGAQKAGLHKIGFITEPVQ
jgi:biopolymer transport protein ExbD